MERGTFGPLLVLVGILSAAIVLAGLSQRYTFVVATQSSAIVRVDELTGTACLYAHGDPQLAAEHLGLELCPSD